MKTSIQVKLLSTAGCPNTLPTLKILEDTAAELGIAIELSQIVVGSRVEAKEHRFHGSPTVQVNGVDIDPATGGSQTFGLA